MTAPTPDRPVAIRPADPADLPEVHRMAIALAAGQGQVATITPQRLMRIAAGPAARIIVVFLKDSPQRHPVGYALMLVDRNMIAGADWGFVEQLYVQDPDRGLGIGRALVAAARAEAERSGCAGVTVMSRPETHGSALVFRAERPLDLPMPGLAAE